MIKGIFLWLLFISWSLALTLSIFSQYEEKIPLRKGAVNEKTTSVGLRKAADEKLSHVSRLLPGEFAPLVTEGKRWVYIRKANREYALPKKNVSLNYIQIMYLFVFQEKNYNRILQFIKEYNILLHLISLMGIITITFKLLKTTFSSMKQRLTKGESQAASTPTQDGIYFTKQQLNQFSSEIIEREQVNHRNSIVSLKRQLTEELSHSIRRDLKKEYDIDKEKIKNLLVEEYREQLSEEINVQYLGKIEDMERATRKMREEFERKKEKAKILGVDLDDSELDNLVKGREFEIFCAHIFSSHPNLYIERWTPDKGIKENIPVGNNGDPDFLLQVTGGDNDFRIAIECKYASSWSFRKTPNTQHFNCVKYYQYKRYLEFQDKESVHVLMLIGVDLPASNPQDLYMFDLSDLKDESRFKYDNREGYKKYYAYKNMCRCFKISKNDLCELVLEHENTVIM